LGGEPQEDHVVGTLRATMPTSNEAVCVPSVNDPTTPKSGAAKPSSEVALR
jgi:hypothetical protein